MVWPQGSEPWRAYGLPVNEELDLEAGKVTAIKKCSQYYFERFRKVGRARELQRPGLETSSPSGSRTAC